MGPYLYVLHDHAVIDAMLGVVWVALSTGWRMDAEYKTQG